MEYEPLTHNEFYAIILYWRW